MAAYRNGTPFHNTGCSCHTDRLTGQQLSRRCWQGKNACVGTATDGSATDRPSAEMQFSQGIEPIKNNVYKQKRVANYKFIRYSESNII